MTGSTCRNQSRGSGIPQPREGKPPPERCNALEAAPMRPEEVRVNQEEGPDR